MRLLQHSYLPPLPARSKNVIWYCSRGLHSLGGELTTPQTVDPAELGWLSESQEASFKSLYSCSSCWRLRLDQVQLHRWRIHTSLEVS